MHSNVCSMVRRLGLVLSLQFTLSANANAVLISVPTPFGADTATLDTSTQRQWLDLSLSSTFSYNQLTGTALASGGQFAGYHLATVSDIDSFISDSGLFAFNGPGAQAYTDFINFANMIGGNAHDYTGTGCGLVVRGISSDLNAGDAAVEGFLDNRGPNQADCMTQMPSQSSNFLETGSFTLNSAFFHVPLTDPSIQPPTLALSGAWLFQDVAAVPLPGTLALVSLGFLALLRIATWKCNPPILAVSRSSVQMAIASF